MVAAQLPGVTFHLDSGAITDSAFRLRTFGFRQGASDGPAGSGIAIFRPAGSLAWIHLENGEPRPHSIELADFDGDGRRDIFYHAGQDDQFQTTVLLNRMTSKGFAVANFIEAHRDDRAYDAILDFDGDGTPELLVPQPVAIDDSEDAPGCTEGLSIPAIRDSVRAEYRRLAGRFDSLNFRYGMESYPEINLALLDSIRIISLATPERRVTQRHRRHLDWRIGILRQMRASSPPECQRRLDDLIAYLTSPP